MFNNASKGLIGSGSSQYIATMMVVVKIHAEVGGHNVAKWFFELFGTERRQNPLDLGTISSI